MTWRERDIAYRRVVVGVRLLCILFNGDSVTFLSGMCLVRRQRYLPAPLLCTSSIAHHTTVTVHVLTYDGGSLIVLPASVPSTWPFRRFPTTTSHHSVFAKHYSEFVNVDACPAHYQQPPQQTTVLGDFHTHCSAAACHYPIAAALSAS